MIGLDDIREAHERIRNGVDNTPFVKSQTLSALTGADIHLKFENLQFTASFKQRGALNRLKCLTREEAARGVIAVSAGNHAQGVAYHAVQLGIPSTIIMPQTTPFIKAARTRELGAGVILHGRTFEDACDHLAEIMARDGQTLIHPYDDPLVIAGQGTVGLEMIETGVHLDTVIVAIGGGGLISGVSTVFKALSPSTEIVGVQSEAYPAMAQYAGFYDADKRVSISSIAEGIAVAAPGRLTRDYVKSLVDDIVVVSEARIEEAVALLLQIEKTLCEGAGAAGLAAVLAQPERFAGRKVGLILCGGNIDNRLLLAILARQQVREGRLLRIEAILADRSGALGEFCTAIGECGGNINSVDHDRTFQKDDARSAKVIAEVEVLDPHARKIIGERLQALAIEYTFNATERAAQ